MQYTISKPMKARDALSLIYPDSSRRTLQNWLEAGRFSVDGKILRREDTTLREGQILISKESFNTPKVSGLKIIYEDRYLIAIDKPSGLLSVPLDGGSGTRSALSLLREGLQTPSIHAVHRIDKDVSGVLLFARGKEAEYRIKSLFEKHDLHRQYFGIVEGRLQEQQGTWKCRISELPNFDVVPCDEGREAITHFNVMRKSSKYSYLQISLETGRKHQIRVHCQIAGHPIVGDMRYGAKENPLKRPCLHSMSIQLNHPFTRKILKISSPLPRSFMVLGAGEYRQGMEKTDKKTL